MQYDYISSLLQAVRVSCFYFILLNYNYFILASIFFDQKISGWLLPKDWKLTNLTTVSQNFLNFAIKLLLFVGFWGTPANCQSRGCQEGFPIQICRLFLQCLQFPLTLGPCTVIIPTCHLRPWAAAAQLSTSTGKTKQLLSLWWQNWMPLEAWHKKEEPENDFRSDIWWNTSKRDLHHNLCLNHAQRR